MNAKPALKGKKSIKNCFMALDCKSTQTLTAFLKHSKSLFSFLSVEALHCHQEYYQNMLFKIRVQQGIYKATN